MHSLAQGTQWTDLILNKYGLAVFAAVLSGVAAYITGTRLEAKKSIKTLKQLSWDMDVNSRLVSIKDELKEKVEVSYAGESVKDLTTVTFRIANTGGATVMNQFVRFAFPDRARMLETGLDPRPEPELDVSEVTEDVPPGNRRYRIGQLEPGQSVQFKFVSDGGDWAAWHGIHPKNEEGGVAFERRDVSRVKADREHVRPFVIQAVLVVLTQLVLSNIAFYGDVFHLVRIAITLLLGGLMLPHLIPIARLVEGAAFRYATGIDSGLSNYVDGRTDGPVIQARTITGGIYFKERDEHAANSEAQ
jgi:hypothetical protein